MIQNREDGPSELLSSLRQDVAPNRNEAAESGALAQWQRELERIYQDLRESSTSAAPARQGGRIADGSRSLPSVEIVDNSSNAGDARITVPGSEAPVERGSPASHAYATRILSEAGGNGTAVARTLLRDLNTGTFVDADTK